VGGKREPQKRGRVCVQLFVYFSRSIRLCVDVIVVVAVVVVVGGLAKFAFIVKMFHFISCILRPKAKNSNPLDTCVCGNARFDGSTLSTPLAISPPLSFSLWSIFTCGFSFIFFFF